MSSRFLFLAFAAYERAVNASDLMQDFRANIFVSCANQRKSTYDVHPLLEFDYAFLQTNGPKTSTYPNLWSLDSNRWPPRGYRPPAHSR